MTKLFKVRALLTWSCFNFQENLHKRSWLVLLSSRFQIAYSFDRRMKNIFAIISDWQLQRATTVSRHIALVEFSRFSSVVRETFLPKTVQTTAPKQNWVGEPGVSCKWNSVSITSLHYYNNQLCLQWLNYVCRLLYILCHLLCSSVTVRNTFINLIGADHLFFTLPSGNKMSGS